MDLLSAVTQVIVLNLQKKSLKGFLISFIILWPQD